MNTVIHPAFAAAIAHLHPLGHAPLRTEPDQLPPGTVIIAVPELDCCEVQPWLDDELQARIAIDSYKADGHRDSHGHWAEREACEVRVEQFYFAFPRRVLIPPVACGCVGCVEWEATVESVRAFALGWLVVYSAGGRP
jgi:hypothetical protein